GGQGGGLADAAGRWGAAYQAREALVAERGGWRCVIALHATDGHAVTVHVDGGRVTAVAQQAGPADLVISADAATLEDILELRRNPNEPYLFGELTVRGPGRHFLRLLYIDTLVGPR